MAAYSARDVKSLFDVLLSKTASPPLSRVLSINVVSTLSNVFVSLHLRESKTSKDDTFDEKVWMEPLVQSRSYR